MYSYLKGKIKEIESSYITLDVNGIGYLIYTANPYSFNIDEEKTIYVYQYVREDEISLYGFKTQEEKEFFLKLISVKGLGCKMALPFFASNIDSVKDAIERENILYLKKFPKIGDKIARQIILDLKGKLMTKEDNNMDNTFEELKEALLSLGYKAPDIKKILPSIDKNKTIEEQIKDALKLLLK